MSHVEYKIWVKYVKNEVSEAERDAYEQHLFDCEECLDLYIKAVELQADVFPTLSDNFTNTVLNYVADQSKPTRKEEKAQVTFKKSFFHYVIAAAMTLILMSTGLFGQLTQFASHFEEKTENREHQSLTEDVIDKSLFFIQIIERYKEVK